MVKNTQKQHISIHPDTFSPKHNNKKYTFFPTPYYQKNIFPTPLHQNYSTSCGWAIHNNTKKYENSKSTQITKIHQQHKNTNLAAKECRVTTRVSLRPKKNPIQQHRTLRIIFRPSHLLELRGLSTEGRGCRLTRPPKTVLFQSVFLPKDLLVIAIISPQPRFLMKQFK